MTTTTPARLLRLLSLLQGRRDWTSGELAARLGVTTRTVRNDVSRLRELGYPLEARPTEELEQIARDYYPQVLELLGVVKP